jgi:hypothetical protein
MTLGYAFQETNTMECIKMWLVLAQVWGEISEKDGKQVASTQALRVIIILGVNY